MADALAVVLRASAVSTASGDGVAVDIGATRSACKLELQLSTISGTGASLAVKVQTALSSSGPWRTVASFPALTVETYSIKLFATCDRYVRITWVVEGSSPSFTFSVAGEAHVLYAVLDDVGRHALPLHTLTGVSAEDKAAALLGATDEADSYLAKAIDLPLTSWSEALTMHVARIAAYGIMLRRGFQPEGVDALIVKMRDDAIAWLKMVAAGTVEPPGGGDPDPDPTTPDGDAARVYSLPARGW